MSGFAYPTVGPFGKCLNQQLQMTFDQNVAFSDSAWENAKQNCTYGCVLPPGLPQWPPQAEGWGITRPIPLPDAQLINTLQAKPFQFDSPFVRRKEYKRFVPNDSPAVARSLENRCGITPKMDAPPQVPVLPSSALVPAESALVAESDAAALATPSTPSKNILTLSFRSMMEAWKGLAYDIKHWKQLPGATTGQKLKFMATHDQDRALNISLDVLLFLSVVAFIVLLSLIGCCCKGE
jgi:hypothetical protein